MCVWGGMEWEENKVDFGMVHKDCLLPMEVMLWQGESNCTVKPPNKGHFGNNINSSLLSFVQRLSSSRRFKMY